MLRKAAPALFLLALVIGGFPFVRAHVSATSGPSGLDWSREISAFGSTASTSSGELDEQGVLDVDRVTLQLDHAADLAGEGADLVQAMLLFGFFSLVRGRAGAGIGFLAASGAWSGVRRAVDAMERGIDAAVGGPDASTVLERPAGYWLLASVLAAAGLVSVIRFIVLTRRGHRTWRAHPDQVPEPQLD